MRKIYLLAILFPLAVGCNTLRRIPGLGKDTPPADNSLPDVYTVTGTTTGNFDLIPVRVADSDIVVKVNRTTAPEPGWHTCDQFEFALVKQGTGAVRLGYLNLTVGGVAFPVAPKGTQYKITSVKTTTNSGLY